MRKTLLLSLFTVGLPTVFVLHTQWVALFELGWGEDVQHTLSLSLSFSHIHTHSSLKTWRAHTFSPCYFPVAEPFSFSFSCSQCHVHTFPLPGLEARSQEELVLDATSDRTTQS